VQRTAALYAPLQPKEPYPGVTVARDLVYGPYPRNVLDVFQGADAAGTQKPVVVFIHGGGFTMGSKHAPGSPFFDNIGVWAAAHGLVGVTIDYRLAPDSQFPSGVEDLTALVSWLQAHVSDYGGNPGRIYLWGHSAGAAHVGDYLAHAVRTAVPAPIAGAILTSGFYDLGNTVSVWKAYYGEDVATYADRSSLPWLPQTHVPLLVTDAELDPDSFRAQTDELRASLAKMGKAPHDVDVPGASHVSETDAVGSGDESLSAPVLDFIRGQDRPNVAQARKAVR
jgi:triacylglycerol lipase